jgi:hypothetical protein
VALVLDNSGSMAGQPISDFIVAAKTSPACFTPAMRAAGKVKVGIVPFAGSVNVGAANQGAAWVDGGGLSPVHAENFAERRTRFQQFAELGVSWGGCVEVRPSPHDVTDSVPTRSVPASLFVPMFAPDEPDPANAEGNGYSNTYLLSVGHRRAVCGADAHLRAHEPSRPLYLLVDARAARRRGPGPHLQIRWWFRRCRGRSQRAVR